FGVAHPAVELECADRPIGGDHEPGIEKAGEGNAVGRHAFDGGADDLAQHPGMHHRRDHRGGRIGAHAAGIGAGIAVEQSLVVLARGEREDVLAVDHHDEARFLAFEEVLDDHPRTGLAHAAVGEHQVDGGMRLADIGGNHHALAGGEAVGLDDDRGAAALDVRMGRGGVGEGLVGGRRDAMALHEGLGEILGGFELRRRARRTEDLESARTEDVDDSLGQRRLGADDGEADLLALGERGEGQRVGNRDVARPGFARGAAVARRDDDLLDPGRARQAPGQRVFAPARADHEDLHAVSWSSNTALVKTCWTSSRSSRASMSFCMRSLSSAPSSASTFGRIVTSATSALSPAASRACLSAPKSAGAHSTSMPPSSSVLMSSAPASMAASITASSAVPGAKRNWPQWVNWNATEPSVPRLPLFFENAWRTSATVRVRLSVMQSTMIAAPPAP